MRVPGWLYVGGPLVFALIVASTVYVLYSTVAAFVEGAL